MSAGPKATGVITSTDGLPSTILMDLGIDGTIYGWLGVCYYPPDEEWVASYHNSVSSNVFDRFKTVGKTEAEARERLKEKLLRVGLLGGPLNGCNAKF